MTKAFSAFSRLSVGFSISLLLDYRQTDQDESSKPEREAAWTASTLFIFLTKHPCLARSWRSLDASPVLPIAELLTIDVGSGLERQKGPSRMVTMFPWMHAATLWALFGS